MIGETNAHGKSLTDALNELTTFFPDQPVVFPDSAISSVTEVQRNAVRSADFVVAATTPGFMYEYNPEAGAFERSTNSRGPVFAESPLTLTRGHLDVGVSYFYSKLTDLNGDSLTDVFTSLSFPTQDTLFETTIDTFDLYSQGLSLYATYGLTEHLDVNLLVPLLLTELHLHGLKALGSGALAARQPIREDLTKVGFGDIIARVKYKLPFSLPIDCAALVGLRVPSGDEDNFQGLGDVVMTPVFVAGRTFGPHEIHANLGVDVNSDDLERSRARYALGFSLRVLNSLSFLVDLVGSSALSDDHFVARGVPGTVSRTDVVDVATGIKLGAGDRLVANLGVIVPLTDDGLRGAAVPFAGFEVTF